VLVQRTSADGAQLALTLGGDYTVALNADQNAAPGGVVTLLDPAADFPTGSSITLTSSVAATQPLSLANGGPFLAKSIEDALDRLTLLLQQQALSLDGAVRAPLVEALTELPAAATRRGKMMAFDASTGDLVLTGFTTTQVANAIAAAYASELTLPFLNATDYGATGDGVTDDTAAIQTAIDAAAVFPVRDVVFNPGNYRTTATLTMPSTAGRNFILRGIGNASYGSVLSSVLITGDHTAGPVVRIASSGQRLENLVITASASRSAGARGSNFGVLMEPPDSSGAEIGGASFCNVTVANQPFHGVVTSGKLFMCNFDGLASQNNKGHGLVVDCGAVTNRTNKGLPGGLEFRRLRCYGNTGHTVVIGLGNGSSTSASSFSATVAASSFGAYRVTIIDADLDCGGAVLDATLGYGFNAGYCAVIKGDSINLQNVAFGGGQSGSPALVAGWLSGWSHKQLTCRYIQCTGVARIKATPSFDAYDFRFENPYLDVSVSTAIVGEDTGAAQAKSVTWEGDTTNVSGSVTTVFRYPTVHNITRLSLAKELAVTGTTYFGQVASATPGVGDTEIGGAIASNGRSMYLSNSGDASLYINRNTSDGAVQEFRRAGSLVGSIAVTTTATAYNTSSDARLKENIAPATGALALLSAIQPRQFDWISTGEHQRFGFVAQELDAVFPEAVTKADDGTYSVDYSKMVPLLAAAILEMQRDP